MQDRKEKIDIRRYKIFLPIAMIIISILLCVLFFAVDLSAYIFVIALVMFFFGCVMLKKWWGRIGETDRRVIIIDKPVSKEIVNSMNIYHDKIIFENIKKPEGQPWKCKNDGKSYHVHIWDSELQALKEFSLPDQTYFDPQILATRVLELPAHRRIFRRKQTLLQQLSPMVAFGGVVIVWIMMITTL